MGGLCLAAAVMLLGWSFIRPVDTRVTIPVRSEEALAAGFPAQLDLTYPEALRIGEKYNISIDLPPVGTNWAQEAIQIEARLELTGAQVEPGSRLLLSAALGRPVTLRWQVTPLEAGLAQGMLWLYGPGDLRLPVLARPMQFEVFGFLGGPIWVGLGVGLLLAGIGGAGLWMSFHSATARKKQPAKTGKRAANG